MKRLLTSMLVLTVFAGVTYGGAVKFATLENVRSEGQQDASASGKAMMNYAADEQVTEIQVNCQGLTPRAIYQVCVHTQDIEPLQYYWFEYVIALPNGRLPSHALVPGDVTEYPWIVGVYRVDIYPNAWINQVGILAGEFPNN